MKSLFDPIKEVLLNVFPWANSPGCEYLGPDGFVIHPFNYGWCYANQLDSKILVLRNLLETTTGYITFNHASPDSGIKIQFTLGDLTEAVGAVSFLIEQLQVQPLKKVLDSPFYVSSQTPPFCYKGEGVYLISPSGPKVRLFQKNHIGFWIPAEPWYSPGNGYFNPVKVSQSEYPGLPVCIGDILL
jgi:hypothetical protein